MRKIIRSVLIFMAALLPFLPRSVFAAPAGPVKDPAVGYHKIIQKAEEYQIPFSMTYEEYMQAFAGSGFDSEEEYADAYLGIMEPMEIHDPDPNTKSGNSGSWYYNTGTILPENADPVYGKTNLYETVEKGDIIFEANGGYGITGHTAIVEGKYYNAASGKKYIRIIEVISEGVVRSCLDETRAAERAAVILRVKGAAPSVISGAVSFCAGQLGARYILDFQKDTDISEQDWYCSELIWAAYYHQGIDLEGSGITEPGITPRDIKNGPLTQIVNYR